MCEKKYFQDVEKFIKLGKFRSKSSHCHGQQSIPAQQILIMHPSESIVPPVLHIKLGLINAKCSALENIHSYEYILSELYPKARVTETLPRRNP